MLKVSACAHATLPNIVSPIAPRSVMFLNALKQTHSRACYHYDTLSTVACPLNGNHLHHTHVLPYHVAGVPGD